MLNFEHKTIHSMQAALGLAGIGYLSFVVGIVWSAANIIGVAAFATSLTILLIRKADWDRLRNWMDDLRAHIA
ncbi:MAG: hypothetical protein MR009_04760 [Sutterellaceae bacterium]|nr:hypothetical protein [Sutterellaceae bacterium]MDD7441553.1 hypothetical protein [Sutterellaceae bacterium]MDY2867282.1 hypothetical protein [Mesosutterella sp.]